MLVVDANVVVPLVGPARGDVIDALWRGWTAAGEELVAPSLIFYEVANALYQMQKSGIIAPDDAQASLQFAFELAIRVYGDATLHVHALEIAGRVRLSATYDAHYLALAEQLNVEFWTADERLYNSVRYRLPWVRFVR